MESVFEGFERWYDIKGSKTILRCTRCGAMDEIKDCEIQTAFRISFAHECWALPAPSVKKHKSLK